MGERIGNGVNEFGLWIPAFAGMTVMVRLPCAIALPLPGALLECEYFPLRRRMID